MNNIAIKNKYRITVRSIFYQFKHDGGKRMEHKENFFQGVISEMKKTSWPTGQEVVRDTTIVVLTVLFFIIFFYAIDLGISELIRLIN